MSYSRLALALVLSAACGSEPPPDAQVAKKPTDTTEVKMESVPVGSGTVAPPPETPGATTPGTTASAGTGDPSEDPNIGGPQDATVEKAVAPIRPRLRACYKKALAADSKAAGSATFDTTIAKDGKVNSARFVKKEGLSDDFVNCLTVAVKAMTFAPDRKTQIVAFTFGGASADAGAPKH
jgi:hypothetical protein